LEVHRALAAAGANFKLGMLERNAQHQGPIFDTSQEADHSRGEEHVRYEDA
jgi:hypothetical protein